MILRIKGIIIALLYFMHIIHILSQLALNARYWVLPEKSLLGPVVSAGYPMVTHLHHEHRVTFIRHRL